MEHRRAGQRAAERRAGILCPPRRAQTSGTKKVNASVDYSDNEGNVVDFPDPTVAVECDVVVHPEPLCRPDRPERRRLLDAVVVDMGDTYLESLGRIIQLDVTVRNVCPASAWRWRSSSPRSMRTGRSISAE